ncbi:MAG: hypothetical protein P1U77_13190 [Rubripirellula sp.]|nr:hypothetical protein [Rubripirellula sp.]
MLAKPIEAFGSSRLPLFHTVMHDWFSSESCTQIFDNVMSAERMPVPEIGDAMFRVVGRFSFRR